ncbi:MAG TPA: bacteriocin [Candidatus Caccopulliclostridium gallistercoris]|uniref:Bacteriocin n=1 Tax=Candidatus Caccopulliclostridium gallistercoris TaxID=2840719 RepID=A0A9D1SYR4_9FIRM|nr:bacteriocin [Candidatus Caccopulliclostridium gallistercoris]
MWQDIINIIISNGIFAILFVSLLFIQIKDSKKREEKYQEAIKKLSHHLDVVEDISEDVKEMKKIIIIPKKKGSKLNEI